MQLLFGCTLLLASLPVQGDDNVDVVQVGMASHASLFDLVTHERDLLRDQNEGLLKESAETKEALQKLQEKDEMGRRRAHQQTTHKQKQTHQKQQHKDNCQEIYYSKDCSLYPDKLVVMVSVGDEMIVFFDNWYLYAAPQVNCSFMQLVAMAEDSRAETALKSRQKSGYNFEILSPSRHGAQVSMSEVRHDARRKWDYNSTGYDDLVARRPSYVNHFMQAGCSVVYSDIDLVWKGDIFSELREYSGGSGDMHLYRDQPWEAVYGQPYFSGVCTGFMYLNPTTFTKSVIEAWCQKIHEKPQKKQPPFNEALVEKDGYPAAGATKPGHGSHDVHRLNSQKFFGAWSDHPSIEDAVLVHANWLKGAIEKKQFLKSNGLWKLDDRLGNGFIH